MTTRKPLAKITTSDNGAAPGEIATLLFDLQQKLTEQSVRERAMIGRWALPSGTAFRVKRLDTGTGLALCTADGRGWHVRIGDLLTLREHRQLRYLGR